MRVGRIRSSDRCSRRSLCPPGSTCRIAGALVSGFGESDRACQVTRRSSSEKGESMRPLRWIMTGIVAIAILAFAGLALAASGPVDVSGLSPFAACTVGGPGTNYPNSEVEPFVAVNPANPSNIVGVFQQDLWSNGGAHGLVASTSHDGGSTWTESWAHYSNCSGGTAANGGDYGRASDPWVTFAPSGDVYQISLSASSDLTVSAVLVSKSTDGGDTWSEPTTLARNVSAFPAGPGLPDKESITADPTNAKKHSA